MCFLSVFSQDFDSYWYLDDVLIISFLQAKLDTLWWRRATKHKTLWNENLTSFLTQHNFEWQTGAELIWIVGTSWNFVAHNAMISNSIINSKKTSSSQFQFIHWRIRHDDHFYEIINKKKRSLIQIIQWGVSYDLAEQ